MPEVWGEEAKFALPEREIMATESGERIPY